jgi:epoxyqueuosine reductase
MTLESRLLEQATALGFDRAGIAAAENSDQVALYRAWLEAGYGGELHYLYKHADARADLTRVYPEVRAVVLVAMNYNPGPDAPSGGIARYARAADYHAVLRERLKALGQWLQGQVPEAWGRVCVDTAPLLERDFARRAGLGWQAKNTMLIHPRLGSWFVLGALLVNLSLHPSPPFTAMHCGTCTRCLEACPTQAFVAPHVLDARRCISTWTIELQRPLMDNESTNLHNWMFGCDICQEVCPWNRKAPLATVLTPRDDLVGLDPAELLILDADSFRARFAGTALYPRPGRRVVLRNAALLLGNRGDPAALPLLRRAAEDPEPLIAEAAGWAIARIEAAQVARSPENP